MSREKFNEEHDVQIELASTPGADMGRPLNEQVEGSEHHGITAKIIAVYLSVVIIAFSGLVNIIGAGAYSRDVAASLGGSSISIWLSQVSAITITILGPIIAQAADYWGRKWFVVLTTLLGFVGCIVVSRANSMGVAIVGQIIAALGYSSQAMLNAIVSEILPRRLRPAAQGGLGLTSGLGAAFSLIFGFYMVVVSTDGWRIYWYVTAGLMFIAVILFVIAYNPSPRPLQAALTTAEKIQRLDWTAYALLAAGLVPLNMALTWSDNPYPWSDAHVSATFAVGMVAFIAFGIHQTLIKKDGLCHHDLFRKDRNCAISFLCIFMEGLSFFSVNNFFPAEMSVLYEPDTFRVGLRASITFFAAVVSAFAVSVYSTITKDIKNPIIVAYTLIVLYTILMATATLDSATAVWAYPLFLGLGFGAAISNVTTAAQLSAPPSLIAVTSGLIAGTRSLGGSIALPVLNSIFQSTLSKHMGANIAAAVLPLGLSSENLSQFITALSSDDQAALASIPGVTPATISAGLEALKATYLVAYRYVWITAGAFSAVAVVAACFLINPKEDLNMSIDAPLQDENQEQLRNSP